MAIKKEIIDALLDGADPQKVFSSAGLLGELKKALAERILDAEMDQHLSEQEASSLNHRNGYSQKTVLTEDGALSLEIPRDRKGQFEPQLISKYQRRFPGFDEKILSMYARGMSVREIQGHLRELYGVEVSPQLISTVTDAVLDQVGTWQSRPLESLYPLMFFDCLRVKIRDEGIVRNKAMYLAIGVQPDGRKDVLGIWLEQTEGAKFWLRVMTELHNRGIQDVLIAVVDGLKGFPEAINAVFPHTQVQTCVVHLLRYSLRYVSVKNRPLVIKALKSIYAAPTVEAALYELQAFESGPWGLQYPMIVEAWRRHWEQVTPFFSYPREMRRIIYTNNAIESLNAQLRRAVRARGHFPTDEAAIKLVWLRVRQITEDWKIPSTLWRSAQAQFSILYPERFQHP